jgi:hypothetical protein
VAIGVAPEGWGQLEDYSHCIVTITGMIGAGYGAGVGNCLPGVDKK